MELLGVIMALIDTYRPRIVQRIDKQVETTKNEQGSDVPIENYSDLDLKWKLETFFWILLPPLMLGGFLYFISNDIPGTILLFVTILFLFSFICFYVILLGNFMSKFLSDVTLSTFQKVSNGKYFTFIGLVIALLGLILESFSLF